MRKIVMVFILCGLFSGCATTLYREADRSLEQGLTDKALKQYLGIIHEDKRKNGTYTDVRALVGAAATYYQMQKYSKTQRMCKMILKIDSRHGGALYYAGASLEQLGKPEIAIKFYRQHSRLNADDPFRPFLEARYNKLISEVVAQSIRAKLRREANINVSEIHPKSLAVLSFVNDDRSSEGDALSKGISEMLISDLQKVKDVKVVDRLRINALIEELQLTMSDMTDANSVLRIGKIIGARNVVTGAFTFAGTDLHITINLVDIAGERKFELSKFSGPLDAIVGLEKQVLQSILDQMGILADNNSFRTPTINYEAFLAYCYGIDQMDQRRFLSAKEKMEGALELVPEFTEAREKLQIITALDAISNSMSIIKIAYASANKYKAQPAGSGEFAVSGLPLASKAEGRLNRMSYHLDLGYIPGKESRQDAAEMTMNGVEIRRHRLPGPPPPPSTSSGK